MGLHMQSWSLDKFVNEHGIGNAQIIWGVSRHAVEKALNSERHIQVILLDGWYHIWEKKLLNRKEFKSPCDLDAWHIVPVDPF